MALSFRYEVPFYSAVLLQIFCPINNHQWYYSYKDASQYDAYHPLQWPSLPGGVPLGTGDVPHPLPLDPEADTLYWTKRQTASFTTTPCLSPHPLPFTTFPLSPHTPCHHPLFINTLFTTSPSTPSLPHPPFTTHAPPMDRMIDTHLWNIILPQLLLRAVNMSQ